MDLLWGNVVPMYKPSNILKYKKIIVNVWELHGHFMGKLYLDISWGIFCILQWTSIEQSTEACIRNMLDEPQKIIQMWCKVVSYILGTKAVLYFAI